MAISAALKGHGFSRAAKMHNIRALAPEGCFLADGEGFMQQTTGDWAPVWCFEELKTETESQELDASS